MSAFTDHRASRMWAAQQYEGPLRPPYPHLTPAGRCLGRVLMRRTMHRGKPLLGFVPFDSLMEDEFRAREKRQNRNKF